MNVVPLPTLHQADIVGGLRAVADAIERGPKAGEVGYGDVRGLVIVLDCDRVAIIHHGQGVPGSEAYLLLGVAQARIAAGVLESRP